MTTIEVSRVGTDPQKSKEGADVAEEENKKEEEEKNPPSTTTLLVINKIHFNFFITAQCYY